ncbi:MAG TPA: thiamine pyrophosphate-dependent enzyme, partial [Atribacterota bacterium]|nr:thiamine pyrophosphate-dependent enzyme [Atribacterota bacterium]
RGHDFVYVCYDNEAYMNTGIQRSSATPRGAWTTTTPVGEVMPGKTQYRKDLTGIMVAHRIPYAAQASIWRWSDLIDKAHKAFYTKGPAFLNILSPCPRGWRYPSEETIKLSKLAVQTNFWPLYEVENGKWKLNYKPKERLSVTEWMKAQGRFKHLLVPEHEALVAEIQQEIDDNWDKLLTLCGEK